MLQRYSDFYHKSGGCVNNFGLLSSTFPSKRFWVSDFNDSKPKTSEEHEE